MRFRRISADMWEFRDIHPLFAELLVELPRVLSRRDKAQGRLFPDPTGGDEDSVMCEDWREHVRPELERLFATNGELVERNLAALGRDGASENRLPIPAVNIDAWLNVLNQARLIIVEENGFTEQDMDHCEPPDLTTRRGLALLKIHFYGHLQELLVDAVS